MQANEEDGKKIQYGFNCLSNCGKYNALANLSQKMGGYSEIWYSYTNVQTTSYRVIC